MTDSSKKNSYISKEQQTIEEGEKFRHSVIPKVINLDTKLR